MLRVRRAPCAYEARAEAFVISKYKPRMKGLISNLTRQLNLTLIVKGESERPKSTNI